MEARTEKGKVGNGPRSYSSVGSNAKTGRLTNEDGFDAAVAAVTLILVAEPSNFVGGENRSVDSNRTNRCFYIPKLN